MIEGNIYIESLKFGYENADKGVSYWQMINHLERKGLIEADNLLFHEYYFTWFYDNFYYRLLYMDRRQNRVALDHNQTLSNIPPSEALMFRQQYLSDRLIDPKIEKPNNAQLFEKAFMMFDARQNYLNYLLIKDTDKKVEQANKYSKIAILATTFGLILSTIIGIIQIYQSYNLNKQSQVDNVRKINNYNQIKKINSHNLDSTKRKNHTNAASIKDN